MPRPNLTVAPPRHHTIGAASTASPQSRLRSFENSALNGPRPGSLYEAKPATPGSVELPKQMTTTKVLFISTNFPPVIGGAAIVYESICRCASGAVVAMAASNEYATGKPLAGTAEYDRNAGYPIHRLKVLHEHEQKRGGFFATLVTKVYDLLLMATMLFRILRTARKERTKVICLGDLVYGGWLVFPLKYLFGYKVIFYVHGEEITTHSGGRFDELRATFLANADAIVSVSTFTRDAMIRLMGIDPAKITVIHNGVNLDRFQVRSPAPELAAQYGVKGRHVILSVGRLVERKGMDHLIEAMPRILQECPDTHLLIAGDGALRVKLGELIGKYALERHVTLLGKVSDAELDNLYSLADIFALPNRDMPDGDTEGFGLVFLEANASGKPVVAGKAGGAKDAVIDGVNGLSVDGTDIAAIAEALVRLLKDSALREAFTKGGIQIAQRSDWRSRTAEFLILCDNIVAPGSAQKSTINP